jgi:hypothetical protein
MFGSDKWDIQGLCALESEKSMHDVKAHAA